MDNILRLVGESAVRYTSELETEGFSQAVSWDYPRWWV
jgi:hypothetical protein